MNNSSSTPSPTPQNFVSGKVVVITGASSGIGEATARLLCQRGAHVVLAARRTEKLASIVAEIEKDGGKALAHTTDIANRESFQALIDTTVKHFGRIDVLINNAAIMYLAEMRKLQVTEWETMIDVNLKGALYGIAATLPHFNEQKSGQFINIGSIASLKPFTPFGTVYSATKHALRTITEGLRSEVGAGIKVTSICPGAVVSEIGKYLNDADAINTLMSFETKYLPPDTIARAILYAIDQPPDVDVNEIVVRPVTQDF